MADEQWRDAYEIAEQMYRNTKSVKRTDLDIYSQIVCARYSSIFSFDPYSDQYSFRNQALTYEEPVASKCRPIADIDLRELGKATLSSAINEPTYMNLTPIHIAPPSTLLVFNHTLHRPYGLTDALQRASEEVIPRPTERDIQPGAEFLYKHRDQKIYRVIILSEVGETNVAENERKYEVAFLDVCQVLTLKLKNLYMPLVNLSLDRFACALQCSRVIGVKMIRSGYIPSYVEEIQKLYKDKVVRRTGIPALVYKTNKKECKIIVDFPSSLADDMTEGEALIAVHGYQLTTDRDPIPLSYEQLIRREILPLRYTHEEEQNDLEDFGDLSSPKATIDTDCPFGNASIDNFFKQKKASTSESSAVLLQQKIESEAKREKEIPSTSSQFGHDHQSLQSESNYDTLDESIASFRSEAVTPKPTFDEPARGDITPTKVLNKPVVTAQKGWDAESPDGWETPIKNKQQIPSSPKKQLTHKLGHGDGWRSSDEEQHGLNQRHEKSPKVVPLMSVRVPESTIQRPLVAPTTQKPFTPPKPIMQGLQSSPKQKSSSSTPHKELPTTVPETISDLPSPTIRRPLTVPLNQNNHRDVFHSTSSQTPTHSHDLPLIETELPIIQTEQIPDEEIYQECSSSPRRTGAFESPANQTVLERKGQSSSAWCTPVKEVHLLQLDDQSRFRKNGSSVGGSAAKSIRATELDDDVFATEEETPRETNAVSSSSARRLSIANDQNVYALPTPRLSTSSSTARLMLDAQANFHDDGDDDGWSEANEEVNKVPEQRNQKEEQEKMQKVTVALREALEAHKEMKTEQLKERIRDHFKSDPTTRTASVSVPEEEEAAVRSVDVLDDTSNKSNCPTVSDASEHVPIDEIADEFTNVPDALKHLAEAFINSVQESVFNKNRQSFVSDIFTMEVIALKSPGNTEQRFWKRKVEEARSMESAFD